MQGGVPGFQLSHDGHFGDAGLARGKTATDALCAAACVEDTECVAFSRNSDDERCLVYRAGFTNHEPPAAQYHKAYMRCGAPSAVRPASRAAAPFPSQRGSAELNGHLT